MKLLATNSVQFTDKVNVSLILNDVWQMLSDSTLISMQAIQDIVESVNADSTNWNLAHYCDSAKNLIGFNSFLNNFKIYFFQLFFIYFLPQKVNKYHN